MRQDSNHIFSRLLLVLIACSGAFGSLFAASYDGNRWFQVEVTIFSNDFAGLNRPESISAERLRLAYPEKIRKFAELADFYAIEGLTDKLDPESAGTEVARENEIDPVLAMARVGPFPRMPSGNLKLPDPDRDPYLLLPLQLSDFQTTNTRLNNSPANSVLFHGVWRQPVLSPTNAEALLIRGGQQYGERHELEGSLTIRFNANEDRVVIDTDLWLSEFTRSQIDSQWQLPPQPEGSTSSGNSIEYKIQRISQMRQSRDMRSTEFHYLDHPAIGLVITVLPYDLPVPASPFLPLPELEETALEAVQ
jgi:hypothetical protein